MIRPRLFLMIIIATLGFGVLGGLLLAQDAESTELPILIDCSPEGLKDLNHLIEVRYYLDFSAEADEIVDNFALLGSLYKQIAQECGPTPPSDEDQDSEALLREIVDFLAEINTQQVGHESEAAVRQIDKRIGDPLHGEDLYVGGVRTTLQKRLSCISCHIQGVQAPPTEEIWDLTINERLTQPELEGYTPQHYIVESILEPDAFIVQGYADIMPHNYGSILSAQDLADLVAYLYSVRTVEEATPDN